MLSRRNIRIKVLQTLYSFQQQEGKSIPQFQKELNKQFTRYYDFYYYTLLFIEDFNHYLESEKELEMAKYFPAKSFIRNTECIQRLDFFNKLEDSEDFGLKTSKLAFNWQNHGELMNRIFIDLVQYDFFAEFSVFDEPNAEIQKNFLINLYEFLFNEFEMFGQTMEDEYPNWDDDSADILKAIINTITNFYEKDRLKLEVMGDKQVEDREFGLTLLEKCIADKDRFDEIILANTANWDSERLTINDMIMLRMALCEFLDFETIPPKVTINEYLDIAKLYSTPKSHLFLNGVLDKTRMVLEKSGRLNKSGRGLKNE